MGTLSSLFTNVRIKIRETEIQFFSDDDLISLSNDFFEAFYNTLRGYDCKIVIESKEISMTDSTDDYAISDKYSLIPEMVFLEGGGRVPVYSAMAPDRFSFEESSSGITFYNHQGVDKAIVYFWKTFSEFTDISDSTPLDGFWDKALTDSLTLKCKAIREHDINDAAYFAQESVNNALLDSINKYGTLNRRMKGTLNV